LAVYAAWFPLGTVFLCVVDPGVGGTRPAIVLEADGRWYVGPGNGLFELIQRRATKTRSCDIAWRPERLSSDDLCEIVYVDHFGNAMTGLRAAMLPPNAKLAAAGRILERERTFSDRSPGEAFWYENSNGLAEIAVNRGALTGILVFLLAFRSRSSLK
jgi:S-adenosylmethionine hydrolase